jgi:hypothetical protein
MKVIDHNGSGKQWAKNCSMRKRLVHFLANATGRGWDWRTLAELSDEEIRERAAERHTDAEQDIEDLTAFGLWPMPRWMFSRGLDLHGAEAMRPYLSPKKEVVES